jgi:hypothetical protein
MVSSKRKATCPKSFMSRSIHPLLLLSLFTLIASTFLVVTRNLVAPDPVSAQSAPITCNPNELLESKLAALTNQAREALDRQNAETASTALQEAITIALQVKNTPFQADIIQSWLIEPYNGFPTLRIIQLNQQLKSPQKSRALLDQLLTLTNRLPSANSADKTRAFIAIARQYAALGQPRIANNLMARSRQIEPQIKAPDLRAIALIEMAEAYAELSQPQVAQTILTQVEKVVPQLAVEESNRIVERAAVTYARIGNYPKAQQTLQRLSKVPEAFANTQEGIVQAYLINGRLADAEKLAQSIPATPQKVSALAKVAIAYRKTPNQSTALFRQATTLAQSVEDPYQKDTLLQKLVEAYVQADQLDAALQLAKSVKNLRNDTLKSVVVAHQKAGKTAQAKVLLSEQLVAIKALNDSWEQRGQVWAVIEIAIAVNQFDWIREEWAQISSIDYGLMDWQIIQIAKAYAQTGQQSQAVEWVRKLPLENRPLEQIKALSAISLVTTQAGNSTLANQMLEQALQTIDPLDKAYQERINREGGDLFSLNRFKPTALASIAVVYSQMQQPEKTRQILQQVVAFSSKIDDPSVASATDNPFAQFVEAKQYLGALQIAEGTAFPDVKKARLQTSALGLLTLNRFDLVQPIANQTTEPVSKTQLLLAIAQRYAELNQSQKAFPYLAQAFRVAQTIPGEESQFDHLGPDGGTVIPIETDRGSLLEAIAIQYARLNQMSEAMKVANTLKEKATRDEAIQKVRCARTTAIRS